ncbi:MAG: alpha/beta fold hydrolase [Verrucomicrobiales bacterium]
MTEREQVSESIQLSSHFQSPSLSKNIHLRQWHPPGGDKGTVLLMHGLGDHVRRHDWAAGLLTRAGYRVIGFDWPGNGESDGLRGDMPTVAEAGRLIEEILLESGSSPVGIFAHSTGAYLLLHWLGGCPALLDQLKWVWLSSPLLAPAHNQSALKIAFARLLARHLPRVTLSTGVRVKDCFHSGFDPLALAALRKDGVHRRISLRFGASLLESVSEFDPALTRIRDDFSLLITQGSEDGVCPPVYAEKLFEQLPVKQKTLIMISGARHEPFREPHHEAVSNAVRVWLGNRGK